MLLRVSAIALLGALASCGGRVDDPPVSPATPTVVVATDDELAALTQDDRFLYAGGTAGTIHRVAKAGGDETSIATGLGEIFHLGLRDTHLYAETSDAIVDVDLATGTPVTLATGEQPVLSAGEHGVHWITQSDHTLRTLDAPGATPRDLAHLPVDIPCSISADADAVYVADCIGGHSFYRVSKSEGRISVVHTTTAYVPVQLAGGAGSVFGMELVPESTKWGSGRIFRVDAAGTTIEPAVPAATAVILATDGASFVLAGELDERAILQAKIGAKKFEPLGSASAKVMDMIIDDGRVYWVELHNGRIQSLPR